MPTPSQPTLADFRKINLQEILSEATIPVCEHYRSILSQKEQAEENQNQNAIFKLFKEITSYHFKSNNPSHPFAPICSGENYRSAIPQDITTEQLLFLKEAFDHIKIDDLKARVADIIWLTSKDHIFGERAVLSYLDSAKSLHQNAHDTYALERLERALRLAKTLSGRNETFNNSIKAIEDILKGSFDEEINLFQFKLMRLLIEFKQGDCQYYANLSMKFAEKAEEENNWDTAIAYIDLKVAWHNTESNPIEANKSKILCGNLHERKANYFLSLEEPNYLLAAASLTKSVEALRRGGESTETKDRVHQKLLDCQKSSLQQFHNLSTPPVDITEIIHKTRERIKNKTDQEALKELVLIAHPPKSQSLRKETIEFGEKFIFASIFPQNITDQQGRIIATIPPLIDDQQEYNEEAVRAHMIRTANNYREFNVQSLILPGKEQLLEDHPRISDYFFQLVSSNPWVPEGREIIFFEGLKFGLEGNYLISCHLLIPQFENSIRVILESFGEIPSTLSTQGIQEQQNLNQTLYNQKLKTILGEDMVFDLQSLLVEKAGANLRNKMAHGLMDENDFFTANAIYFWWLILRLLMIPILNQSTSDPN